MSTVPLALLPLVVSSACLFIVGIYSLKGIIYSKTGKEATFMGSDIFYGSPAQIAERHESQIYTQPWLGSVVRVTSMLWNILGMIYILRKAATGQPLRLPSRFFYYWASAWAISISWAFVMDREMLVMTTVLLAMAGSSYGMALKQGCQFQAECERQGVADKLFPYIVLEGLALLTTWTFIAFAMTVAMSLANNETLDSESTGFLTMEESTSIGLILDLFAFVIWWILDVAYWGKGTDYIKSTYVIFFIAMSSITVHNYYPDKGTTLNNIISSSSAVLSAAAFATRRTAKKLFLGESHHLPQKNHIN